MHAHETGSLTKEPCGDRQRCGWPHCPHAGESSTVSSSWPCTTFVELTVLFTHAAISFPCKLVNRK